MVGAILKIYNHNEITRYKITLSSPRNRVSVHIRNENSKTLGCGCNLYVAYIHHNNFKANVSINLLVVKTRFLEHGPYPTLVRAATQREYVTLP